MNTIITPISSDALDANVVDGRPTERTRRAARRDERAFLRSHSGLGARTLYRIASVLT